MTDFQPILDTAFKLGADIGAGEMLEPGALYKFVVPDGWHAEEIDTEHLDAAPRRAKATPEFTLTSSFAAYVERHKSEATVLYADGEALIVRAVLNDLGPLQQPGWRDHVATLRLTKTPGWLRWVGAHGQFLSQTDFAELIDAGITEIAQPAGADLLELAQSIKASSSAAFRSDKRLANGRTQFSYVEEIDARAGADGQMEIPETITLVVEPFFGAPAIQIEARLRYRLSGGKLVLGIWLVRHHEALRDAFDIELQAIENDTELRPLWGKP